MSVINAGSGAIEFWEDVADSGGAGGTFEHGASGITQMIRVNFADQQQAITDILGNQFVFGSDLVRNPPLQHSLYPAFYATKVSLTGGLQADGKYVAQGGMGNDVAQYTWVRLQITYTTLPFSVNLSATGQPSEFFRYVSKIPQPGVEFLKVGNSKNGTYKYVTNAASPPAPSFRTVVPFGMNVRLQKTTLQYKWWWVPEAYLFNSAGLPTNIINGIGKVNNAAWPNTLNGFPAGTLLAMPAQFEAINSPNSTLTTPTGATGGQPNKEYNVMFNFLYFAPPYNAADLPQGHNAAPFNDGLYYQVQTVNGGNPLYPLYDFNLFFTGV
jgi:hypothetical protein